MRFVDSGLPVLFGERRRPVQHAGFVQGRVEPAIVHPAPIQRYRKFGSRQTVAAQLANATFYQRGVWHN